MKDCIVRLITITLLSASQALAADHWLSTDHCNLSVDNTSWDVSAFEQNGSILGYHPTPWVFQRNGRVSASGYWKATWKMVSCDRIHVDLTMDRGGKKDVFDVVFLTSNRFVAVTNDTLYRFGKKR